MNYLAHALLAGDDDGLLIGGLIADVHRRAGGGRPTPAVRAGIRLHHELDRFADGHALCRRSAARLQPACGRYAGVLVDVVYDHLLAADFHRLAGRRLPAFVAEVNARLQAARDRVPDGCRDITRDVSWLADYAEIDGVRRSLARLARRSRFAEGFLGVLDVLAAERDALATEFESFFADARGYARERRGLLRQPQLGRA